MGIFHRRTEQSTQISQHSPRQAVTDAIAAGESSRAVIAEKTGLQRQTVDMVIETLERRGELRREAMGGMCPGGGCSSCGHATAEGSACSSGGHSGATKGPVALVLQRRTH